MNKKNNNFGFTLIELLAVITIVGILMMIAIPSTSQIIDSSRRDSFKGTMKSYITSLKQDVMNGDYQFADEKYTVFAVPIECIDMENRGEDPFGEWTMANDDYWAYVLVQWDPVVKKFNYGFTFKDSVGWGLYPTSENNFNDSQTEVAVNLDIYRPRSGLYSNIAGAKDWAGFKIDGHTPLQVLEANYEGIEGDGRNTCTLISKEGNYEKAMDERVIRYQSGKPCGFTYGNASTPGSKVSCGGENFYLLGEKDNYYILMAEHQIRLSLDNPGQDASENGGWFVDYKYYLTSEYGSLLPRFGKSFPAYIYGNYEGNAAYPYLRAYEDYLENEKNVKSAGLTIPSLEDVGEYLQCPFEVNTYNCTSSPYASWLNTSYYWFLGTVKDAFNIYTFAPASRKFELTIPVEYFSFRFGYRPLLFIEKSDLE